MSKREVLWSGRGVHYNGGYPGGPQSLSASKRRVVVRRDGVVVQKHGIWGGLLRSWSDDLFIPKEEIAEVRLSQSVGFMAKEQLVEIDVTRGGQIFTAIFAFSRQFGRNEGGAFYGAVSSLRASGTTSATTS